MDEGRDIKEGRANPSRSKTQLEKQSTHHLKKHRVHSQWLLRNLGNSFIVLVMKCLVMLERCYRESLFSCFTFLCSGWSCSQWHLYWDFPQSIPASQIRNILCSCHPASSRARTLINRFNVHGTIYLGDEEHIAPVEQASRDLSSGLQMVKDEQAYLVVRERIHRNSKSIS